MVLEFNAYENCNYLQPISSKVQHQPLPVPPKERMEEPTCSSQDVHKSEYSNEEYSSKMKKNLNKDSEIQIKIQADDVDDTESTQNVESKESSNKFEEKSSVQIQSSLKSKGVSYSLPPNQESRLLRLLIRETKTNNQLTGFILVIVFCQLIVLFYISIDK